MSSNKRYDICAVNQYRDQDGNPKSSFSRVGIAFTNIKDGREVLSLKIGPTLIVGPRNELVLFEQVQDGPSTPDSNQNQEMDDEIPF